MMQSAKKRRRKRLFCFFLTVVLLMASALVITESRIRPVLTAVAESNAKNMATEAVNDAVRQVLYENDVRYDNLVSLSKNQEEKVTAIMVDSVKLNAICAEIRGLVADYFSTLSEETISIPLGSLTGVDMLSGKGPSIYVGVTLSGSSLTKISNDFATAGINQTRHQMVLEIDTKIYVLMQSGNFSTEVVNSVVIAETVIVGDVPEIYSDGTNDMWQNLMGYE